jgi:glycosyltransferase involved in cell wall biosynthesis
VKKRRVVFIMPNLVGGGAERILINVVTALDRAKFEPVLFLQKRMGPFLDHVPPDVPVYFGSEPPGKTSMQLPRFFREFLASTRGADVIVGFLERTPGYLAVAAGFLRRKPALAMVHVNLDFYLTEVAGWNRWASRLLYPLANGMIFCSRAGRDSFMKAVPRHPRALHVLHNPIDLDAVRLGAQVPLPDTATQALSKPFLLGVGRLERQKGFDLLIEAFAQVVQAGLDYHLVILGEGPDRKQLEARVHELNLSDRVFLLGFTRNPFSFFKAADMFVLSSRFEGMPTVVIEAMALGVATICFDGKSGTAELFDDGKSPGILVPAEDVKKLAEAIITMARKPDLRRKCIEDGLVVSERYLMKNAIKEWESVLSEVSPKSQA